MKSLLLLLLCLELSHCARNDHSVPIIVPVKELSNGVKMPVLGLGTFQARAGQVEPAIVSATVAGYRLIDTADVYENEEAIGSALQFLFNNGSIKREDLFITTKLPPSHFAPDQVISKLSEQLIRLKLDYVDLYLMHFPAAMKPDGTMDTTVKPEDTWKEMENLYKQGKARAIGVSNFNASQIHRILKIAKTPPHVLQVETHIHFVQKDLQELCHENNITMEAYAPLGAPGRPPYLLPKGHPYPWPPGPKPLLNPQVLKLAGKYGKPPASILLRYLIQRGLVAIPKSVSPERIYENIQVFDFKLTDKEMETLSNQKPQQRVYPQDWIKGHPEDPFAGER